MGSLKSNRVGVFRLPDDRVVRLLEEGILKVVLPANFNGVSFAVFEDVCSLGMDLFRGDLRSNILGVFIGDFRGDLLHVLRGGVEAIMPVFEKT